nr:phage antirepressor KilAC domain-containing protein [Hungatella hathewayi]
MAEHICLMSRTEKGKQCRQYLLNLKDAWNSPEQIMARALKFAQNTMDSLKSRCKFLGGQIIEQQKVIEELQPKASYYDMILQCKDLIATTVIAKDYGMSARKFNAMLHDKGVQFKQGDTWVLYAKYQGQGYLKAKTCNYADSEGVQHSKEHAYWTQRGRLFLYDFLKQEGILPLIEQQNEDV